MTDIHGVHPYPCKYPASVISSLLQHPEGSLLDPFCGSGTTLVEGAAVGWPRVLGFDSNPIATMITEFKLLPTDDAFFESASALIAQMQTRKRQHDSRADFDFEGRDHWFHPNVLKEIGCATAIIDLQPRKDIATWLRVSLSRILNRLSRQESETRYVAIEKPYAENEPFGRFVESCVQTLSALKARPRIAAESHVVETVNILDGLPLRDRSVDRIVTSPPYANTMDYYLYHKQRMNILGFDFKIVQNHEIGSRHEFSSKREPVGTWERDYASVLREMARVLRDGKHAIVIIGDSQIAGEKIDAAKLTAKLANDSGFGVERIDSIALDGRSRSFSRGFQRPNKFEHTITLKKLGNESSTSSRLTST